jgi:hypothetical protein
MVKGQPTWGRMPEATGVFNRRSEDGFGEVDCGEGKGYKNFATAAVIPLSYGPQILRSPPLKRRRFRV